MAKASWLKPNQATRGNDCRCRSGQRALCLLYPKGRTMRTFHLSFGPRRSMIVVVENFDN
ncbi:hypothetical protein C8Q70DRAFT_71259 [Cubamyces menziesii]|nr:hypothetical protein C8Q70DRAFT_71259 [Cubamyces menziesii]